MFVPRVDYSPHVISDQGAAHFAAVHKVFGASNASKMLQGIPDDKRLDAVVTLCYEALARVRDPVYGSVGHIFTLQQQAHISTLRRVPLLPQSEALCPSPTTPHLHQASEIGSETQHTSMELSNFPLVFKKWKTKSFKRWPGSLSPYIFREFDSTFQY
ncbi:LOB domain-containing protein 19 [Hibiscus syriacus]|uniref:LOB domain-containing protein 19 n=1 Tax=Hibiscus syriacus TaxID=106335 RepID=A0A6A2XKE9_HIBSY|nr:LOB domain-containing protein 19 [Hibiscus syriacus]